MAYRAVIGIDWRIIVTETRRLETRGANESVKLSSDR